MEILIFIGGAVLVWIVFSIMNGNLSFWKVASKQPDMVYMMMLQESDIWVIEDGDPNAWEGKNKSDFSGPFRLFIPSINSFVKIYGRADRIEEAQQRIMDRIHPPKK